MSNSSSKAHKGITAGRPPVHFESLENRTMLSVTASVVFDPHSTFALLITGDSANNAIAVSKNSDGTYKVMSGSSTVANNVSGIERIVVFGNDGNDSVIVGPDITVPAYLYGGAGNDSLRGGAGADVIVGGDGDDLIVGNGGRNLLVGGLGEDRMAGDNQDDIFVSGASSYDTEGDQGIGQGHFVDLMREWNRNNGEALPGLTDQEDYAERVFHILIPGTGNNAFAYLSTADPFSGIDATVFDDGATDVMTGNQGEGTAVFSIEQVKVAGNGEIDGDVHLGIGFNVKFSGNNAEVDGDIVNEAVILPDVNVPVSAINLGNYNKTSGTHTLAAGVYVASSFSLSGTAVFNTDGPVTIYVTGSLSLAGQSVGNDNSSDLQFYVTSSNTVQIAGQGVLSAQIYASKSEVQVSGNGVIEGQVKAKRVTVTGNGLITYDTGLATGFDLFFFSATTDIITDLSGEEFAQDLSFIFEL